MSLEARVTQCANEATEVTLSKSALQDRICEWQQKEANLQRQIAAVREEIERMQI